MTEQDQKNFVRERNFYLVGFVACLVLTIIPFVIVVTGALSFGATLGTVGAIGLLQIVLQFRFFLHIDLSEQKREDLQLILFSTLLLIIMALGTIWILGNLAERMR